MNIDEIIRVYLELREQKAVINKEIKELDRKMDMIEHYLLVQANKEGVLSFKSVGGTAYISKTDIWKIVDSDMLLEYIRSTGNLGMLNKALNKNVAKEYLTDHGIPPPGVEYNTMLKVNVRKAGAQLDDYI
jgi:hypothetical protein